MRTFFELPDLLDDLLIDLLELLDFDAELLLDTLTLDIEDIAFDGLLTLENDSDGFVRLCEYDLLVDDILLTGDFVGLPIVIFFDKSLFFCFTGVFLLSNLGLRILMSFFFLSEDSTFV